jgi:hypothetical protein
MNEFMKPWSVCPSCHQFYENELRILYLNRVCVVCLKAVSTRYKYASGSS